MIGQGEALLDLSATLQSWSQSEKMQQKPMIPLSLLFVGSKGVGKSHTAKYLAKLLLKSCHELDLAHDENSNTVSDFLDLDGSNFAKKTKVKPFSVKVLDPSHQYCGNDLVTLVIDFILERRGKAGVI